MGGEYDGGSPWAAPSLAVQCWQFLLLLPPLPHRKNGKERREGAGVATLVCSSEGGDVIECVVQLLADGLVLHLLGIDFIWGVRGMGGRWECGEREWRKRGKEGRREGKGKERKGSERGGQTEKDRPENRLDSRQGSLPSLFCPSLYPKLVLPPGAPASPGTCGHSALDKQECLLKRESQGAEARKG